MNDGDWICTDSNCGNINFARRGTCYRCNKERPESSKKKLGVEIGKSAAEKSRGLFNADDWQCSKCANVNWARRSTCNVCNAPKFGEVEARTGYGGGYNERDNVEYRRREESSDDEYDEFGRLKKKRSAYAQSDKVGVTEGPVHKNVLSTALQREKIYGQTQKNKNLGDKKVSGSFSDGSVCEVPISRSTWKQIQANQRNVAKSNNYEIPSFKSDCFQSRKRNSSSGDREHTGSSGYETGSKKIKYSNGHVSKSFPVMENCISSTNEGQKTTYTTREKVYLAAIAVSTNNCKISSDRFQRTYFKPAPDFKTIYEWREQLLSTGCLVSTHVDCTEITKHKIIDDDVMNTLKENRQRGSTGRESQKKLPVNNNKLLPNPEEIILDNESDEEKSHVAHRSVSSADTVVIDNEPISRSSVPVKELVKKHSYSRSKSSGTHSESSDSSDSSDVVEVPLRVNVNTNTLLKHKSKVNDGSESDSLSDGSGETDFLSRKYRKNRKPKYKLKKKLVPDKTEPVVNQPVTSKGYCTAKPVNQSPLVTGNVYTPKFPNMTAKMRSPLKKPCEQFLTTGTTYMTNSPKNMEPRIRTDYRINGKGPEMTQVPSTTTNNHPQYVAAVANVLTNKPISNEPNPTHVSVRPAFTCNTTSYVPKQAAAPLMPMMAPQHVGVRPFKGFNNYTPNFPNSNPPRACAPRETDGYTSEYVPTKLGSTGKNNYQAFKNNVMKKGYWAKGNGQNIPKKIEIISNKVIQKGVLGTHNNKRNVNIEANVNYESEPINREQHQYLQKNQAKRDYPISPEKVNVNSTQAPVENTSRIFDAVQSNSSFGNKSILDIFSNDAEGNDNTGLIENNNIPKPYESQWDEDDDALYGTEAAAEPAVCPAAPAPGVSTPTSPYDSGKLNHITNSTPKNNVSSMNVSETERHMQLLDLFKNVQGNHIQEGFNIQQNKVCYQNVLKHNSSPDTPMHVQEGFNIQQNKVCYQNVLKHNSSPDTPMSAPVVSPVKSIFSRPPPTIPAQSATMSKNVNTTPTKSHPSTPTKQATVNDEGSRIDDNVFLSPSTPKKRPRIPGFATPVEVTPPPKINFAQDDSDSESGEAEATQRQGAPPAAAPAPPASAVDLTSLLAAVNPNTLMLALQSLQNISHSASATHGTNPQTENPTNHQGSIETINLTNDEDWEKDSDNEIERQLAKLDGDTADAHYLSDMFDPGPATAPPLNLNLVNLDANQAEAKKSHLNDNAPVIGNFKSFALPKPLILNRLKLANTKPAECKKKPLGKKNKRKGKKKEGGSRAASGAEDDEESGDDGDLSKYDLCGSDDEPAGEANADAKNDEEQSKNDSTSKDGNPSPEKTKNKRSRSSSSSCSSSSSSSSSSHSSADAPKNKFDDFNLNSERESHPESPRGEPARSRSPHASRSPRRRKSKDSRSGDSRRDKERSRDRERRDKSRGERRDKGRPRDAGHYAARARHR